MAANYDKEEWKPVVGYEGLYEVSSSGRVRSMPRVDAKGTRRRMRYHSGKANNSGYPVATLVRPGESTQRYLIHILVSAAFSGPKPAGMQVNHVDGNKGNNEVGNLEYVTPSQNVRHAWETGLAKAPKEHWGKRRPKEFRAQMDRARAARTPRRGERHHNSRLTANDIRRIRREVSSEGRGARTRLAQEYGVTLSNICAIVKGKTWTHIEGALQ